MTSQQKPRGMLASVPRRVKLLIFSLSLNSLAFGYFIIYVTAFFPEVNITPDIVGTLLGVQGGVLALAGIPLGVLSDRRGRKWILILGNAALVPTILLFALTRSIPLYFLAAILGGFAEAGVLSSWNAIIADQTDLDNRDAAFSLSFITSTIFTSIGSALPFIFPVLQRLLAADSYTIHSDALAILGLGNVIPPILIWVLLRDYKETTGVRERTTGKRNLGVLFKFSGANSMIGLGAGFIIPLIPTWLYAKFAVPDTFSGPLLSLAGITIGLSAVASPVLARRFGLIKAIVMTAGSSTLFMFSLAFIPNVALAGGIYVVRAALMNMSAPLMDSFLMGVISPDQRGFASAVNAVVWRFPNSISTIFGGIILASGRFDVPFYLATALYVTGISLLYLNFKNVKPKG